MVRMFLVLLLTSWKTGASLLSQSLSVATAITYLFSTGMATSGVWELNFPFLSKVKGKWGHFFPPLDVSPSRRRWEKGTQGRRRRMIRMFSSVTARLTLPSAELTVIDPWPHRKSFPGCQDSCNRQKTNSWKKRKAIKLSAGKNGHLKFKFRRSKSVKTWVYLGVRYF